MNNLAESNENVLPDDDWLTANAATKELLSVLYKNPAQWSNVWVGLDEIPDGWRPVFVALRNLHQRGVELTRSVLADELKKLTGYVDGISDIRMTGLLYGGGSVRNLDEYQRIIREAAELERLILLRHDIDGFIRRREVRAGWTRVAQSLTETPEQRERRAMSEVLWSVFEKLDKPDPVVPTGFEPLDRKLAGGLRGGEVFVLAARPGVGKSALALQFLLHMAEQAGPVTLWSLEMAPEQWIRRALSFRAVVNSQKFRTSNLDADEYPRVAEAAHWLNNLPVHFADTTDTTPDGWRMEAMRAVREDGAKVLCVDYLQLLQAPPGAWSRENEVSTITRTVKLTALQLDVPVILLAQLNREAQDRAPTLRNLRESGAIEQDADAVCFIHRDIDMETGVLKNDGMLILAKQRDGETGVIPISYESDHYRFIHRLPNEPREDRTRRWTN